MPPRWVLWVLGALALIWLFNDPAGMGNTINDLGDSIKTFFRSLG
jgi:hypothetical protein